MGYYAEKRRLRSFVLGLSLLLLCRRSFCFTFSSPTQPSHHRRITQTLFSSRSLYAGKQRERSKRQERVGQLIQTELARIIHSGLIKGHGVEYLDADLRRSISLVQSDVSPDLRHARVTVSIRGTAPDSRKAYSWLVQNSKPLKYSLAQKMSHMKTCPDLNFVEVDISAAVDVMNLIDRVSKGSYKRNRDDLYNPDSVPTGIVGGLAFDDEDDDEDWDGLDDEGFFDALE